MIMTLRNKGFLSVALGMLCVVEAATARRVLVEESVVEEEEEATAPWYIWCLLIFVACVSFWVQAVVTEERFVPALSVVALKFNIPDDIAGATLMAAGASSPELFSSFVALFITHSALGLGTIVGSEIFNQLIICAGAVYASRGGSLQLDPYIVTREVGFYLLSIILLYLALRDHRPDPSDPSGVDHIYISFGEACMVFAGYIAYVIVCANMEAIVNLVKKESKEEEEEKTALDLEGPAGYGATGGRQESKHQILVSIRGVGDINTKFLIEKSLMDGEPAGNFKEMDYSLTTTGQQHPKLKEKESFNSDVERSSIRSTNMDGERYFEQSKAIGQYSDGASLRKQEFLVASTKPSDEHGMYDVEINLVQNRFSCFMWQRSYFYTNARLATNGWNLRWFTLQGDGKMYSVPNRGSAQKYIMKYPAFTQVEVDEKRMIIRIINPEPKGRSFYLMAPSREILNAILRKMEELMEFHENKLSRRQDTTTTTNEEEEIDINMDEFGGNSHDHESLIEFPSDKGFSSKCLFIILSPIRFLMHWTVPDVRTLDQYGNPNGSLTTAFIAIVSCLLWLIVGSYFMVSSLEGLADLMKIPDAVVGVTVSAAGTSLPNYVASKIAAQKGFGNMAVSNAFGSNTFNIMIGLGLPWALYTSFGTGFQPYNGLKDEGITESVVILGTVLLVFIVIVLSSGFVLYKWHGNLFIVMYVAYIVYEVLEVYLF